MSMTTKERAAAIRAELKSKGWTSRDVSVRFEQFSLGSSVHVTIKNPAVPLAPVKAIASAHERIDYCPYSGEILSGSNRHVEVRYERRVLREMAAPIAEQLRTVASNRGERVDVGHGWEAWRSDLPEDYWFAAPIGEDFYRPAGHIHCWGLEHCAELLAIRFVELAHAAH